MSGLSGLRGTGRTTSRRRRGDGAAREARHFFGNLPLMVGLIGIALIVAAALFGPQLAPYDPNAWQLVEFGADGKIAVPPIPPGEAHPLGTDTMGRDLLSRLLWGARLTLAATLLTVVARTLLGVAIGLMAGWRGGIADAVATQATNTLAGFPQLMLALLLVILLKDQGFLGFVVALAVVGWGDLAQFIRAEVIRLRGSAYIEAAQALGATTAQILRRHILRNLAPQLAGLVALEAGAVLLLLAELGFIGFFIAGGTFFVDDAGRPVLPVRDRAPEWGQMLAGARYYAFAHQWIAIVPALIVGAAILAFNLCGEGVRAALDPFGPRRLAPRTLDIFGRAALAAILVGVTGFGVLTLRSSQLSFEEGLTRAQQAATRVEPGAELVAAVVRFNANAYGLGRPEKLNYYFRAPGTRAILYVGFPGADANAQDVQRFRDDDGLATDTLQPLGDWQIGWEAALESAERRGGTNFRNSSQTYTVQLILEQPEGWERPIWRAAYRNLPTNDPSLILPLDAVTGENEVAASFYTQDATTRARQVLGTTPDLLGTSATWWGPGVAATQTGGGHPLGPDVPAHRTYAFAGEDGRGRAYTLVTYDARRGLALAQSPSRLTAPQQRNRFGMTSPLPETLPQPFQPLIDTWEPSAIYQLVDDSGGRAIREGWQRNKMDFWTITVNQYMLDGRLVADASYTGGPQVIRYRADLATRQVVLLP